MSRTARIVVVGSAHHITQRGNNKTLTFFDNQDYRKYLFLLEKYKNKYKLDIYTYCLMPNHIHIKAIPRLSNSFAKTINYTQMCYSQYFNKKYKRIGHLWQSRFFSSPLDQIHSHSVSKYIELNPVKANLVDSPEEWEWSSARNHLKISKGPISLSPIEEILHCKCWKNYLNEGLCNEMIKKINTHTLSGKPLGDNTFTKHIEKLLGVSIRTRPKRKR